MEANRIETSMRQRREFSLFFHGFEVHVVDALPFHCFDRNELVMLSKKLVLTF
jgi:hypothetical protein